MTRDPSGNSCSLNDSPECSSSGGVRSSTSSTNPGRLTARPPRPGPGPTLLGKLHSEPDTRAQKTRDLCRMSSKVALLGRAPYVKCHFDRTQPPGIGGMVQRLPPARERVGDPDQTI